MNLFSRRRTRQRQKNKTTTATQTDKSQNRRINNLMASLSRFLTSEKYQSIAQKAMNWYDDDFWGKMTDFVNHTIPYTSTNNDCVAIHAYLRGKEPREMKEEMLRQGY